MLHQNRCVIHVLAKYVHVREVTCVSSACISPANGGFDGHRCVYGCAWVRKTSVMSSSIHIFKCCLGVNVRVHKPDAVVVYG